MKPVVNDFSYLTDLYHGEYPKVLIQLPMYNEDAHCDLIIHRCCKIKWPSHRILIQVRLTCWGWVQAQKGVLLAGPPGVCGAGVQTCKAPAHSRGP